MGFSRDNFCVKTVTKDEHWGPLWGFSPFKTLSLSCLFRNFGHVGLLPEMKDFFSSLIIEKFAKRAFNYWQLLAMAVDFLSASWALTCWLLFALGRFFYRVKNCSPLLELKIFCCLFQNLTISFQILKMIFFPNIFHAWLFFKFSECLTINRMGNMKKGSVPFLLLGCEDITAQCKKWQISFQASLLSSLLKEPCTSWQIKGLDADFFFSTLNIAFCCLF